MNATASVVTNETNDSESAFDFGAMNEHEIELVQELIFMLPQIEKMQKAFKERGEYITLAGVLREMLAKGQTGIERYWEALERSRTKREGIKGLAQFFNRDGSISDPEALKAHLIEHKLVRK